MERAPSTSAMLVLSGVNEATVATAVVLLECKPSSEKVALESAFHGIQLHDIHAIFRVSSK